MHNAAISIYIIPLNMRSPIKVLKTTAINNSHLADLDLRNLSKHIYIVTYNL